MVWFSVPPYLGVSSAGLTDSCWGFPVTGAVGVAGAAGAVGETGVLGALGAAGDGPQAASTKDNVIKQLKTIQITLFIEKYLPFWIVSLCRISPIGYR